MAKFSLVFLNKDLNVCLKEFKIKKKLTVQLPVATGNDGSSKLQVI